MFIFGKSTIQFVEIPGLGNSDLTRLRLEYKSVPGLVRRYLGVQEILKYIHATIKETFHKLLLKHT